MARKLHILMTLMVLAVGTASAQDARTALETAMKAMGGTNLKTIQYSGSGNINRVGQTYGLNENWPRYEVSDYTRTIDYDAKWSREDYNRRQGKAPLVGLAPIPEEHVTSILSGKYAWDMKRDAPVPLTTMYLDGTPYSDLRQVEIAITPHGFLKAALAASDATAITIPIVGTSDLGFSQLGRKVTIVSFTMGKYRINGTINDKGLIEIVDTWIPNPMYGDMNYEMRYTIYKDFGGVKFPTLIHVHQGDPTLNPAHDYYEIVVTDVKTNIPVTIMPVPDVVKMATLAPAKVESQKLADGVWLLGGSRHNSVLVEFKDFVAIVEAPENEARSIAVMAEADRLVPNKLVKYVVNTHHHMDAAGGLRTYLAQGTTIVTHESNVQYYQDILFHPAPRTLQPDRLSMYKPLYAIERGPLPIETVSGDARHTGKYVIDDGERILEIYHVQDMTTERGYDPALTQGNHSADMLMVYLPKEKILINADLYTPSAPGTEPPASPTRQMVTLYLNMRQLNLDVARHVAIQGGVGTNDEFIKLLGKEASLVPLGDRDYRHPNLYN